MIYYKIIYPFHVKMELFFSKKTIFKKSYKRNNKSQINKNILCFPNHKNNQHIVNII